MERGKEVCVLASSFDHHTPARKPGVQKSTCMKKIIALAVVLSLVATVVHAQNPNAPRVASEDSIRFVVARFANSLRTSDARSYLRCFADSTVAIETLVYDKRGIAQLRRESLKVNADVIAQQPAGALLEQVEFGSVKVDGPLAFAWVPYKLFYEGKLQYCGVQSFQFIRIMGVWKIFYMVETRYTNKCGPV